jgi:hypothetical protein
MFALWMLRLCSSSSRFKQMQPRIAALRGSGRRSLNTWLE